MKKRLFNMICFGALMCLGHIQAQQVSGSVSDATGPLPGASVVVKGTTIGVQTDFDGNYTIPVDNPNAILVFSYIGHTSQEIPFDNQSTIDVILDEDAQALDEVVVVGYGSQEKKEITTAITSVNAEDFNQGTVNDPAQLIQGKVAGLTIANRGADPNSEPTIRLRGISTIGGNQEPLVVIDGVMGGSLRNVDPNDIANMTVLKDGSAAAIYGTRGSSGVILVTTKSGEASQSLKVNYSGQFASTTKANVIPAMNSSQFLDAGGVDLGSRTDWIDSVTHGGFSQVHNLSAEGGTENVTYRVSTNFRNSDGILINSGFDQFNARTNFTARLFNNKLKMIFNSSLTQRDSKYSFDEAFKNAVLFNPTAPIYGKDAPFPFNSDQYGGYFETLGLGQTNPVGIVMQNKNDGSNITINYNMNFDYTFTDHISANINYAGQNSQSSQDQYYPTTSQFRGNATSLISRGRADFLKSQKTFTLFEGYGTYTEDIKDFVNFSIIGGYSYQESDSNSLFLSLGDFPSGLDFDFSNSIETSQDLLSAGKVSANTDRVDGDRIIAFFGRLNATFDNAIYLNASLRREGSSRFGSENQWGTFPSIAIGSDLNKYFKLNNVNLLKARIGYGITGSIPPQVGLFETTYSVINGVDGGSTSSTGSRAANPDLKWEEKAELNLGFEFSTDRLSATLDLYKRNIDDFISLVNVDAALYNGIGTRYENAGKLSTKGLEFTINYDILKSNKINYNSGLVFSTYKTILEENPQGDQVISNLGTPGQNSTNLILVKEGEEIGRIWGPVFSGDVDASGSQILVDINGDGKLVTGQSSALAEDADFEVLGYGVPDFEVGWSNDLRMGNWTVSAFFRGVFGHSLVNAFRAFYEPLVSSSSATNNIKSKLARSDIRTSQFSSLYVEKADFVRLQYLTVGYTIPLKDKFLKNLNLSLSGQNLFTITGYSGIDPEPALQDVGENGSTYSSISVNGGNIQTTNPNPLAPGIERRTTYFTSRTFTFGLNLEF